MAKPDVKLDLHPFYFTFSYKYASAWRAFGEKAKPVRSKVQIFCFVGGVSYLDCGKNRTKTPKTLGAPEMMIFFS